MGSVIQLTDQVLKMSGEWRHRATLFAFANPLAFYIIMGCTLPQYLKQLDQLEEVYRQLKERA